MCMCMFSYPACCIHTSCDDGERAPAVYSPSVSDGTVLLAVQA